MSKYIDAEKLLNKSYSAYPSIDHYCCSENVVAIRDILNAPTVDVDELENKIKSMEATIKANEKQIDDLMKKLDNSNTEELLGWRKE